MQNAGKFVLIASLVAALAACSGTSRKAAPATGPHDRWGVEWLCRPGETSDPCASDLATTVIEPSGAMHLERLSPSAAPRVDCFYVYPTVSGQPTVNANLEIDFRLQAVALAQVARFSQLCRVYAPVYRQITLAALDHPGRIRQANALEAYNDVLRAFHDYLAHYNDGRGIVFIGHSQGAAILDRLLAREVDRVPALRRRLVVALLMGGNVTSRDFAYIPACTSTARPGCIVAYSSFTLRPSDHSLFGRITSDAGVRLLSHPLSRGRILCVNPAAPGGGTSLLHPAFPSFVLSFLGGKGLPQSVSTAWVSFPRRYKARCDRSGDASWLQVAPVRPGITPTLARFEDPAIGLHILDVNIALDDLVRLARDEVAAYSP